MNREELVLTLRIRYVMSVYNGKMPLTIDDIRVYCEKLSYQKAYGLPLFCACPCPCTKDCSCTECWEEAITKFLSSGDVDVSL